MATENNHNKLVTALFLSARSQFLHETVFQCLQDNKHCWLGGNKKIIEISGQSLSKHGPCISTTDIQTLSAVEIIAKYIYSLCTIKSFITFTTGRRKKH